MEAAMNIRTITLGACCFLLSTVPLAAEPDTPGPLNEIDGVESLLARRPEVLADEVIRAGEIRFLGIAGFTVSAPGIDTDQCVAEPSRIFVVPKTSDVLTNGQMALQARAEAFASKYNKIVRDDLVKKGTFESFIVCVPGVRTR